MKETDSSGEGSTTKSLEKLEYEEEEEDEEHPKNGSSSSSSTVEESERKKSSTGVRQYIRSKTPRLRWTPDLHLRFVHSVERLGGQEIATPKQVLQMMNIKGLSIAHVKSHLQMYRSKKIDDQGQVINDKRHLMGNWDHHIHNPRQLDHMLQGFNQRLFSNYSDTSWSTSHVNLMNLSMGGESSVRERIQFYASLAQRNFRDDERKMIPNPSFLLHNEQNSISMRSRLHDEYRFPYHQTLYQPPVMQTSKEASFVSQLQARRDNLSDLNHTGIAIRREIEEEGSRKRKVREPEIDLNLSLNVTSGRSSDWEKESREEDVDFSLSLSLFPQSKKEKHSLDLNNLQGDE